MRPPLRSTDRFDDYLNQGAEIPCPASLIRSGRHLDSLILSAIISAIITVLR